MGWTKCMPVDKKVKIRCINNIEVLKYFIFMGTSLVMMYNILNYNQNTNIRIKLNKACLNKKHYMKFYV